MGRKRMAKGVRRNILLNFRLCCIVLDYLPKSLTYIGNSAFKSCSLLSTVYYAGTAQSFAKILIESGNDALLGATLQTGQRY